MQTFFVAVLAFGCVSSLGSGPYLPSGWRPEGPAFYLPTEVQKTNFNQLQETVVAESESSGSEALREYGPPKLQEVSQDLTLQGLPDTEIDRSFSAINAKFTEENLRGEYVTEVVSEIQGSTDDTTTTEVPVVEYTLIPTEALTDQLATTFVTVGEQENANIVDSLNSLKIYKSLDVEENTSDYQEAVKTIEEAAQQKTGDIISVEEIEVKKVEEDVKNISEALVNLENEIKTEQVIQEVANLKSLPEGILPQVPEGFLEYGPPGFLEYGPPNTESSTTEDQVQDLSNLIVPNVARRRRFSPKFRAQTKH